MSLSAKTKILEAVGFTPADNNPSAFLRVEGHVFLAARISLDSNAVRVSSAFAVAGIVLYSEKASIDLSTIEALRSDVTDMLNLLLLKIEDDVAKAKAELADELARLGSIEAEIRLVQSLGKMS